jgi:hypothetical protein
MCDLPIENKHAPFRFGSCVLFGTQGTWHAPDLRAGCRGERPVQDSKGLPQLSFGRISISATRHLQAPNTFQGDTRFKYRFFGTRSVQGG